MRLYEFIVLAVLLATSAATFSHDASGFEQGMGAAHESARHSKRLRWQETDAEDRDVAVAGQAASNKTEPVKLEQPVRIALFNAGGFYAYLKLNYILNDLQDEQEVGVPIENGYVRDLLLPHAASHIRIRVDVEGFLQDQHLIDVQYVDFDEVAEICFLLAGDRKRPVYGLCPFPYKEYFQFWTRKH